MEDVFRIDGGCIKDKCRMYWANMEIRRVVRGKMERCNEDRRRIDGLLDVR